MGSQRQPLQHTITREQCIITIITYLTIRVRALLVQSASSDCLGGVDGEGLIDTSE